MKLHLLAIVALCGLLTMSCVEIYDCSDPKPVNLNCKKPDYLKRGDKVALISPSFFTPIENAFLDPRALAILPLITRRTVKS